MKVTQVLGVFALAGLISVPGAAASGEFTDPCGPDGLTSATPSYPFDVTLPWLDLCGGSVTGTQGAGIRPAITATLRVAGDTADRAGSAIYAVRLTTDRCQFQATHTDTGPTETPTTRLVGSCNDFTEPCPLPVVNCFTSYAGDAVELSGSPAVTSELAGDTVRIVFDPNKLEPGSVPPELAEDFEAGALVGTGAITWLRAGTSGAGYAAFAANPMDEAQGPELVL